MRSILCGWLLVSILGGTALAQQPATGLKGDSQVAPPGVSPDVWAYIQELRRLDDPKLNAMRTAQFKAQQRQARLATQQWFGYSNLRPVVNPIPYTGQYSPSWGGNSWHEYQWSGGGYGQSNNYVPQAQVIYVDHR